MKSISPLVVLSMAFLAAACSGPDAVLAGDGIPGWKRTGPPERYNKEGLYGYIDGGAEIVLEYGFRELAVSRFGPAAGSGSKREIVLEIYRMSSGDGAFGLYSTKLEGEEKSFPGIEADNWLSPGQASLVKGEFLVNILAPECTEKEIGEFMAAVEPQVPGHGTARPEGLGWLPREGLVPSSRRYVMGPLAARNESPFLDGDFWGFGGSGPAGRGVGGTEAFSAKYGVRPEISKLVVVRFAKTPAKEAVEEGVSGLFKEYLRGVRRDGEEIEGRNDAGRWFLFKRAGSVAALVLGDPDEAAARARLEQALGLASGRRGAAPAARPKPFLVVTFDTEDYISPEAEHIDDIPKWLAETMTEEGVTGTFFVIGEKARSLEKRGRGDVIAAMARHDIGSHTNYGSIHPTVTEQLEKAGWEDGVRLMSEQESAGIRELERIFGIPVKTLARHGGSYGPQLVAALGRLGTGYQGSPASLPGHDVVWFCNALNFSAQYAGFDDAYYRDDLFEPVFDKLKAELAGRIRTAEVLALFAGHPTKIRAEEFWDLNFYNGKNTPPGEWRMPRLRPRETMVTAQKNFRRMMSWLAGRDDIEITTYRELMDVYGVQKGAMTRAELREIARKALGLGILAPTGDFSPAEAFAGLAFSITGYFQVPDGPEKGAGQAGSLPGDLRIEHPLGPTEMPPTHPEIARVKIEDVRELARQAQELIRRDQVLPATLRVGSARIGTGSLFGLFSAVYLDLDSGKPRPEYDVPAFEPYPRTNESKIVAEIEGYKTWPVHRPDLDMSRIVEFTRLQLWTLKPARRR